MTNFMKFTFCLLTFSGGIEILDVTFATDGKLGVGDRLVALKHACANVYLSCDKYGQARACNHKSRTSQRMLNHELHCISGVSTYNCPNSPYVILENAATYNSDISASSNQYKMRFESSDITDHLDSYATNDPKKSPAVYYASISKVNWEFRLQSQSSILDGALRHAVLKLWPITVRQLFSQTVRNYNKRRRRTRRNNGRNCILDPTTVRDHIIRNLTAEEVEVALNEYNVNDENLSELSRNMAWLQMTTTQRKIFVERVSYVVRELLRNALLTMGDIQCLRSSQWGHLTLAQRAQILDRYLTLKWLERKLEASRSIVEIIQSYIDRRTSTFTINEVK